MSSTFKFELPKFKISKSYRDFVLDWSYIRSYTKRFII